MLTERPANGPPTAGRPSNAAEGCLLWSGAGCKDLGQDGCGIQAQGGDGSIKPSVFG